MTRLALLSLVAFGTVAQESKFPTLHVASTSASSITYLPKRFAISADRAASAISCTLTAGGLIVSFTIEPNVAAAEVTALSVRLKDKQGTVARERATVRRAWLAQKGSTLQIDGVPADAFQPIVVWHLLPKREPDLQMIIETSWVERVDLPRRTVVVSSQQVSSSLTRSLDDGTLDLADVELVAQEAISSGWLSFPDPPQPAEEQLRLATAILIRHFVKADASTGPLGQTRFRLERQSSSVKQESIDLGGIVDISRTLLSSIEVPQCAGSK